MWRRDFSEAMWLAAGVFAWGGGWINRTVMLFIGCSDP